MSALPSTHRQLASLAAEETLPFADSLPKDRVTLGAVEMVAAEEAEDEVASPEADQTLVETDVDIHLDTKHIPTHLSIHSNTEDSMIF